MKSAITALMVAASLTSCAPARFDGLACPPVPIYSAEQQHAAAEELQSCAKDTFDGCDRVFSMMSDYHVMRGQSLACRKAYAPSER
jgi:hypothetical protein